MTPRSARTVRDAAPGDAAAIAEVHNQSIAAGDATLEEAETRTGDVRRRLAGLGPREVFLVVEEDGAVLGWGLLKPYSERPGYRFAGETAVYVRRERLGEGLGTEIQRALIERCRRLGYHHLTARTFADNAASMAMHRRLGYEVVGVQREIGFKDGRWRDVAVLQLVLDDDGPASPGARR